MFNLTYDTPAPIKGIIRCYQRPMTLGPFTDVEGGTWDIKGIFYSDGYCWVQACPRSSLHPDYTDTSGASFGYVSQRWEPYEIVEVHDAGDRTSL